MVIILSFTRSFLVSYYFSAIQIQGLGFKVPGTYGTVRSRYPTERAKQKSRAPTFVTTCAHIYNEEPYAIKIIKFQINCTSYT